MRPNWLIKGYSYCLKTTAPGVGDADYSIDYIWVNVTTNVAYVLSSITSGVASWVVKVPDSIINEGQGGEIRVIGETAMGDVVRTPGAGLLESEGYMKKSVYDPDNDGIVDEVELVDGGLW